MADLMWTPDANIQQSRRTAQNFWQTPDGGFGSGWGGALAAGLSGLGYGLFSSDANAATQRNQTMRQAAFEAAGRAPNNLTMGRMLMGSGVPDLAETGLSTIAGARDKATGYAHAEAMAEKQRAHARDLATLQEQLAEKRMRAELEIKQRMSREESDRMLGLLGYGTPRTTEPAAVTASPPTAPGYVPSVPTSTGYATVDGAVPGITRPTTTPSAPQQAPQAPGGEAAPQQLLQQSIVPGLGVQRFGQVGQATPSAAHAAPSTGATGGMTSAVSADVRQRAAMALAMGQKDLAAKILTEDGGREATKSYDAELGKGLAKDMNELRDNARRASKQLAGLGVMRQLIDSNTPMGPGTSAELAARKALAAIGIGSDGLGSAQFFQAIAAQMTLQGRELNGGMPGAMSDKDRTFLESMGPQLTTTREGNRLLVDYMTRLAKREIDVARAAQNYASQNGGRIDDKFFVTLGTWAEKNPLFPEADKMAPAAGGGSPGPQPGGSRPAPGQAQAPRAPVMESDDLADIPDGAVFRDNATGQRMRKIGERVVPEGPVPGSVAARSLDQRQQRTQAQADTAAARDAQRAQVNREFRAAAEATDTPEKALALVQAWDARRGDLTREHLEMLRRAEDLMSRLR